MSHRKSRLKLKHQGLAVNADVRTAKLDPAPVEERPTVVRRDAKTGSLVVRQLYDKATGKPLAAGYGHRWVSEDGEEVPREDVDLSVVEDDEEVAFSLREPTLGADRTVTPETWIPVPTIDQYLVEGIYELWGAEPIDVVQLVELAEHIRDTDEAPVIPFLLQPATFRNWGIVTPFFFEDSFAMVVRVTDRKIDPEHAMPVLTEAERERRPRKPRRRRTPSSRSRRSSEMAPDLTDRDRERFAALRSRLTGVSRADHADEDAPPGPGPIDPMLATRFEGDLDDVDPTTFLAERKFDGTRLIAEKFDGRVSLYTRRHVERSGTLSELTAAMDPLPDGLILDGEYTNLTPSGTSQFEPNHSGAGGDRGEGPDAPLFRLRRPGGRRRVVYAATPRGSPRDPRRRRHRERPPRSEPGPDPGHPGVLRRPRGRGRGGDRAQAAGQRVPRRHALGPLAAGQGVRGGRPPGRRLHARDGAAIGDVLRWC